ncbi:MAG: FtsQ-type POTRA domain-containing protein [Clostridia bacterium]|nr:FtsQ-type POTRA domain-containing protein [Clostridia bacterium]
MKQTTQTASSEKLREYNARRKKKYKRRRKTAVYLLLLFFVCVVCLILSLTVFFKTSQINVSGNSRYTASQVVKASGVEKGDNLLRMSRSDIKESILKKLPYVSEVQVIRELPSTVTIKIKEAQPSCRYLAGENRWALLSQELRVMEITSVETENVPVLSGITLDIPGEGETATADSEISEKILLDLLTILKENDIINVDSIVFTGPINVSMRLEGRVTAKLGGDSDLDYKVRMVKTWISGSLPSVGEWTVDVTSGDKLYAGRGVASSSEESVTEESGSLSEGESEDSE